MEIQYIKMPKCTFCHKDCFAYFRGGCAALKDTKFENRHDCPFLKDVRNALEARFMLEKEIIKKEK